MHNFLLSLTFLFLFTSTIFSQTIVINEVVSLNKESLLDEDGDAPDWIELYFSGNGPTDLSAYGLSDDRNNLYKWAFPSNTIISDTYLVIFASGKNRDYKHTNFALSSSGEGLYLTNPSGVIVDSIHIGALPADVSLGRNSSDKNNWVYYLTPTPGTENNTPFYTSPTPYLVNFSQESGLYNGSVTLLLSANSLADSIYYTLDGSLPNESSTLASGAIELSETKVLRASIWSNGVLSDQVATHSYIIDKETNLPVISISAIPKHLWDKNTGIYEDWESDKEIPVHIDFFTPEGSIGFSQDAGMKIFGGWSRHFPQKSFALFARNEYGKSNFAYTIFPNLPYNEYESFVLRNSGGDFDVTHVRDAMMQGLISDLDIETQAYRPAVIYLNGEYWGILNIREKLNENYIEAHFDVKKEALDMLENEQEVIHGDSKHYNSLLSYIQSHDMTKSQAYSHIKEQLDLNSYLNYMTSELYLANVDWPGWNIKYWRPRTESGKWRWLVYDLDDGFGLGHPWNYGSNTMFEFATATDGDEWPNPPWSTLLFRKLLQNNEFTTDFLNRYADNMNTLWQASLVNHKISTLQNEIAEEMHAHLERWDLSYEDWLDEMDNLHEFSNERIAEVHKNTLSEFNLSGLADVDIQIEPAAGGTIVLNNHIDIWDAPWHGIYYQGIPINIQAVANQGYKFSGWDIDGVKETPLSYSISLNEHTTITATFELTGTPASPIVINEINYNSAPNFDAGDWVELYNYSNKAVDLSGWVFKDEAVSHSLIFPQGTTIGANDFLVLCQKQAHFLNLFPALQSSTLSFDFGLSNGGEQLNLFNAEGEYIDSLTYSDNTPWPLLADGTGATLTLKNPYSNNALAQNWTASSGKGTPGVSNGTYTKIEQRPMKSAIAQALKNYPNPFSIETTLSFKIEQQGKVQINIFNLVGTQVANLTDKVYEPGLKQLVWKPAANLEGGVYIYQVHVNNETNSGIMIYNR